jgi:hypothetical protein
MHRQQLSARAPGPLRRHQVVTPVDLERFRNGLPLLEELAVDVGVCPAMGHDRPWQYGNIGFDVIAQFGWLRRVEVWFGLGPGCDHPYCDPEERDTESQDPTVWTAETVRELFGYLRDRSDEGIEWLHLHVGALPPREWILANFELIEEVVGVNPGMNSFFQTVFVCAEFGSIMTSLTCCSESCSTGLFSSRQLQNYHGPGGYCIPLTLGSYDS